VRGRELGGGVKGERQGRKEGVNLRDVPGRMG